MSILAPGARCSSCSLVDFLPLTCQYCILPFCSDHIGSHRCLAGVDDDDEAGPSTSTRGIGKLNRGKKACALAGCERESIESIAGLADSSDGDGDPGDTEREKESIAREVRCRGCGGAYCVSHRSQASHSCSAPLDHNARHDAFLVRREKARELIAQRFPEHAGKVVPKPPPQKDVVRTKPVMDSSKSSSVGENGVKTITSTGDAGPAASTALSATPTSISTSTPTQTPEPKTKVKTKADKLWDIHLRKIRSSAEPLLRGSRVSENEARRFFECTVDMSQDKVKVRSWLKSGKIDGKAERVWVLDIMPVGKIMDLMIAQSRTPRPSTKDPSQALNLLCLFPDSDGTRQVKKLDLSKPASGEIVEGSLVVLVRGDIA
ncbi:hypothetical protein IAU59_005349 [Kwoniella sp. CBS 9459]